MDKIQVRCWVSGPTARAMVREAMMAAGLSIEEEHESHLVYQNLSLETSDENLILGLKVLLRAVLPIAKM